jgi:hypothetical protein
MPWLATRGAALVPTLLFVLGLLWLSAALGRRVLIWLGTPSSGSSTEHAVASAAIGFGVLEFGPFVLGAAGKLSVSSLRLAVGVVVLAAARDLWAVARRVRYAFLTVRRPESWLLAGGIALLPAVGIAILLALTPVLDPDGLAYHLTVPKRWLEHGSMDYLPTYPYSNAPMGGEMLFAIALAFVGDAGAKLLHCALGLAGAAGLLAAGKRIGGGIVGPVAASLYLVGPFGVADQLGWAYVEGITAFATIAATLSWLVWYRERHPGWLRASALLAGVGVSFKITAALFPLTLLAMTIVAQRSDPAADGPKPSRVGPFLWLLALTVVPILPWFIRSTLVTGNPFFPLFAQVIHSRDYPGALATTVDRYQRYMLWASRWGPAWSSERRHMILVSTAALTVVATSLVYTRLRSPMARGTALVLLGTVLVQLFAVGLYGRYWIPLASVLALPLVALVATPLSTPARRWALVAVAAMLAGSQARTSLRNVDYDLGGLARTAFGLEERRTFVIDHLGLYSIWDYANRELPEASRILLSTTCPGFYLDRTTYCAEFVQTSLRFASWSDFVSDVRRLGITHVIAPRALAANDAPDPPYGFGSVGLIRRKDEYSLVRELLTRHGTLMTAALDQGLYAIDVGSLP